MEPKRLKAKRDLDGSGEERARDFLFFLLFLRPVACLVYKSRRRYRTDLTNKSN